MALPENAPIADALDIILDAKQKKLSLIERQILTSNIEQLAKGNTIKDLDNLSEKEWSNANDDVPKMCKVYLLSPTSLHIST